MNRVFLLLIFAIPLMTGGCGVTMATNDRWLGEDKAKHFLASALIAGATAAAVDEDDQERELGVSVGVALSIGAGKEALDAREGGSGWSWKDMAWDLLGALSGYYAVDAAQ